MNKKYFLLILLCMMVLLPVSVSADDGDGNIDLYTGGDSNCCDSPPTDQGSETTGDNNTDGGGEPDDDGPPAKPGVGGRYQFKPVGYAYGCSVTSSTCTPRYGIYGLRMGVSWNIYDMYNNSIIDQTKVTNPVIAGTHFGAKLYEYRTYTWWAKGTLTTTITCRQKVQYACTVYGINPNTGYPGLQPSTCEKEVIIQFGGTGWNAQCQDTANRLAYNVAREALERNGASYTVSVTDPNDVRCNYPEKYADELARENIVCNNYAVTATSSDITSFEESYRNGGKVTKYYYYQMFGACINAKTSRVRYINKDEKCTEDEYFVENDYLGGDGISNEHWHVFTPINTKETEGYTLTFKSNTKTVMDGGLCQNAVEKYANNFEYALYIKPLTGSFTYNLETDKRKVRNGCYTELVLKIPTVQKFYGEEITETTDILKGFNFYYRPIDISNPFPNGINDDSYWKEWRDSEMKEPDIEESFDEITYWTNGIDLNEIRDYNYENTYLDWETMEINGFSTFITDKTFLNRKSTITPLKVYSLGCAPTNMCEYYINKNGERVENPIYQPECKDTRDMVVCP